jgi:hypothetical protein
MRVFLDTNVLLDVFLKRAGEPASARVLAPFRVRIWNRHGSFKP